MGRDHARPSLRPPPIAALPPSIVDLPSPMRELSSPIGELPSQIENERRVVAGATFFPGGPVDGRAVDTVVEGR